MPQPATRLVQISQEILTIVNKNTLTYRLSEFEIQRIFRYAAEMKPIDTAAHHSLLGIAYCFAKNEQESISNHEKAIGYRPDDIVIVSNYGTSLLLLKRFSEAKDQLMLAYNLNKCDPMSLSNAILAAYHADDLKILPELLEAYNKLTSSPHEAEIWLQEDAHDSAHLEEYKKESMGGPTISLDELKKELGL
jgi:tetratricopeptide (TPR) repeat protein